MCSQCSPGKLRLPYDSSHGIVCRTCYRRARRFFADLIVDSDARSDTDQNSSVTLLPIFGQQQHIVLRGDSFAQHGIEDYA